MKVTAIAFYILADSAHKVSTLLSNCTDMNTCRLANYHYLISDLRVIRRDFTSVTHGLIEFTLAGIIVLNVVTPEETLFASSKYLSCMTCSLSGCHLLATIYSFYIKGELDWTISCS